MKKLVIFLILGIFLFILLSILTINSLLITTFSNGLTEENLTFIGNENITRNLSISKYVNITSAYLNLSGYTGLCYQETANVSTACGGLSTGNYVIGDLAQWQTPDNMYDGNWSSRGWYTGGEAQYLYINYTKLNYAISSLWQVADGEAFVINIINLSIPSTCWDYNKTKLILRVASGGAGSNWTCYNGGWYQLRQTSDEFSIYEEAMIWNILSSNLSIIINNTQIWNYTGAFNQTNNKTNNFASTLNTALNNGICDCSECSLIGNNCSIPFTFHSDTAGVLQYSDIQINYDTSKPIINLTSPLNNSWQSIPINFICNSSDSEGLNNITLYGNWTGSFIVNETKNITGISNSTTFSKNISDGTYIWNCYVCDNDEIPYCVFASSNFTLNIDSTYPLISITSPTNNFNTTNTGLYINYTVSDTNLNSCWYSNDTFSSNTTLTCGTNITTVTWSEGQHNVTIWANDSANNVNSSSVTFYIDTTPPSVTIAEPQSSTNYANNNSMSLNYSVSDVTTSVSSCWYNVYLVSPYLIAISNTTIANCLNTTFSLQGGDEDYQLNFYANDTVNNINKTTVNFGIRTDSPAISLNAPANNQYFNNGTNIYFNFTATDSDNLSSCRLYGNWTGSWAVNYTWVNPNSGVMNYTTRNITSDGVYIWNVWCNDTLNNDDFSPVNRTFTIDTTNPEVNITTSNASTFTSLSLSINFNISDTNIDICYFTLRDSTGAIHNYAENTSVTCSDTSRAISTLVYGTFTFELWGEDLANNLNSDIITFTTTSPPTVTPGGGGISAIEDKFDVIGIQQPKNISKFSELERGVIYSSIYSYCEEKIGNPSLAITDYYKQCSLSADDLNKIIVNLNSLKIFVTFDEMKEFYIQFKNNKLFNFKTVRENIDKYGLIQGVLGFELILSPSSLDKIFLYKPVLKYVFLANQELSRCEIVSENSENLHCSISNTTMTIFYNMTSSDFVSRIFSGKVASTSLKYKNTIYTNLVFRVYNPHYLVFNAIPIWIFLIGVIAVISFSLYYLIKVKRVKKLRKLGEILT